VFDDDNLGAACRELFVGSANIRSSAYLSGYNIDFLSFSRSLNLSAFRNSF
jgi:hypothetical protein